jgi:hypothetical protein
MDLFAKTCKSCGATIRFVSTEFGNTMPIDAEPFRAVLVDTHGIGRVVTVHRPHFETCPDATKHRKGGGNENPNSS